MIAHKMYVCLKLYVCLFVVRLNSKTPNIEIKLSLNKSHDFSEKSSFCDTIFSQD